MDLLMKLERQAREAQGRVIVLLGNHEVLVTEQDYTHTFLSDGESYADFMPQGKDQIKDAVRAAFSTSSPYAKWIASRPTAVVIEGLFIHAGAEDWMMDIDWGRLNATVRAWMLYLQGSGERPPEETRWVLSKSGPLWTRSLALGKVSPEEFDQWLKKSEIPWMAVGHTVPEDKKIHLSHSLYGERFVMLDAGMTAKTGGELSAVEWTSGQEPKVHAFSRPALNLKSCHEYLIPRNERVP